MRLPFHLANTHNSKLCEKETENGTYVLWAIPSWPCYKEGGAGVSMNYHFELIFTDKAGNSFRVEELEEY